MTRQTSPSPVPAKRKRPQTVIGWRETARLPDLGTGHFVAKVDTGARTSALHANRITLFSRDGVEWVRFQTRELGTAKVLKCELPVHERRRIRNTSGVPQERIVVRTTLELAGRRWKIDVSLANRQDMGHPLILGRTALRGQKFLIDCGRSFLATDEGLSRPDQQGE